MTRIFVLRNGALDYESGLLLVSVILNVVFLDSFLYNINLNNIILIRLNLNILIINLTNKCFLNNKYSFNSYSHLHEY